MPGVPSWLDALLPIERPLRRPLLAGSTELAWHVAVEFEPWRVPAGVTLTGSQTWNGKALLVPSNPSLDVSVGEVELVERLRSAFPNRSCYWTAGGGHPPRQWRSWALTPEVGQRAPWLIGLDRQIRDAEDNLRTNRRGWPDVLSWESEAGDLFCVEYKGPVTSNPDAMDTVSREQDAWFRSAVRQQLLLADHYAVVAWVPSPAAKVILREQASTRLRRPAVTRSPTPGAFIAPAAARDSMHPTESPSAPSQGDDHARPVRHGDERLYRRTIRSALKQRLGVGVVSHIDGTIDAMVPPMSDPTAFLARVVDEVTRLGYTATAAVVPRPTGGWWVRISTPETLAQQGRGAHGPG